MNTRTILAFALLMSLGACGFLEEECPSRAATCPEQCDVVEGARFDPTLECYEPREIVGCQMPPGGDEEADLYAIDTTTGDFYHFNRQEPLHSEFPWKRVDKFEEKKEYWPCSQNNRPGDLE